MNEDKQKHLEVAEEIKKWQRIQRRKSKPNEKENKER